MAEIRHHPWVTGSGKYPVPRWSDNPNLDAKRDEMNHNYQGIIANLAAHSIREQTFNEGEVILRQDDTGDVTVDEVHLKYNCVFNYVPNELQWCL